MLQKRCAKNAFLLALCVQLLSCWRTIILSVVPGCRADSRLRKWSFTGVKATDRLALSTASMARGSPLRWVERHALMLSGGGGDGKVVMYCCSLRWLWNRAAFPLVNISLSRPFRPSQHSIYHLLCAFAMSALSFALLALPALTSHGLSCKQPLFWFLP